MAYKTNILNKMVNVNFTINEVNRTLTVEPLHHFHDNGKGYFYIWSPRQRMGHDEYSGNNKSGLLHQLNLVQNNGQPYHGQVTVAGAPYTPYANSNGLEKPKYLIEVPSTGEHTISIHPSDIGSPTGWSPNPPYINNASAHEHFPNNIVRGDHGWDALSGKTWNWLYRYEWEEQGIEMVDTIVSERGVGGLGSKYHRSTGWGHPIGRCGCYTYPVIQNNIGFTGESMLVSDVTEYSVTCGGETKNDRTQNTSSWTNSIHNGVGDEYKEGIEITRPEVDKNGVYYYKNKRKLFYPIHWPEHPIAATHADALSLQSQPYFDLWVTETTLNNSGGVFPTNNSNVPGSIGNQYNKPYHNRYPERYNVSQIARSNTEAWNRIDKIENPTGVEFLEYRHSLIQKVDDNTVNPNTGVLQPVTFMWEHLLVDRQTPHSSDDFGRYPEPTHPGLGKGYLMDLTDLALTAVNIGPAVPQNHAFYQNHPAYGEFVSRISGVVRKSTTLDVCGSPQLGIDNPDRTDLNWRNKMFSANINDDDYQGPYSDFYGAHVHGVGGTNFNQGQKNGGRGGVSRFMSTCKRPWTGDRLRNSTLVGTPQSNPENWPDITHLGSKPDYTALPAKNYLGGDSWKWDGYSSSGYTTTPTKPASLNGTPNTTAWPTNWPREGQNMRNWIGGWIHASSPFMVNSYGAPVHWHVNHLNPIYWTLSTNSAGINPNGFNTDGSTWGVVTVGCITGTCYTFGHNNRFALPSIKELDSPSYFNHIVAFEEEEDSQMDYGHGNDIHPKGYDCVVNQYGPNCEPYTGPNQGAYNTYTQCNQHCNPNGTI